MTETSSEIRPIDDPASRAASAAVRLVARRVLHGEKDRDVVRGVREALFGKPHGVGRGTFGLFMNEALVGVISYEPSVQCDGYTEIGFIALDESAEGQKFGGVLLHFAEQRAIEARSVGVLTYADPETDGPGFFAHEGYAPHADVPNGFVALTLPRRA